MGNFEEGVTGEMARGKGRQTQGGQGARRKRGARCPAAEPTLPLLGKGTRELMSCKGMESALRTVTQAGMVAQA